MDPALSQLQVHGRELGVKSRLDVNERRKLRDGSSGESDILKGLSKSMLRMDCND